MMTNTTKPKNNMLIIISDIFSPLSFRKKLQDNVEIKSFNQATQDKAIRYARTCHDHLAGQLGVKQILYLIMNFMKMKKTPLS
jgi:hypothetical protein